MKQLYYFELKKIICKRVNQIAMFLGLLLMIFCNIAQIQGETFRDGDKELSGVPAILKQEEIENSLTSELNEEFLTDFLREYQRQMEGSPYGYDWEIIEPQRNLFSCISKNYADWNEQIDLENLIEINTEGGIGFYDRRMQKIETLLNAEYTYGNFSEAEKEYWMAKANAVDIPFQWGGTNAWDIIWTGIELLFYLFFVISICIAPVFSGEYQNRTDALLLTSKHGKSKVISAKILAAFTFSFIYISVCSLVNIGTSYSLLGIDGRSLPIQLWDTIIPYRMTVFNACIINLSVIFLISLFITAFSLLVSTLSKSPMIVLALDILLFFGTIFLPSSKSIGLWNKILYLLPLNCIDLKHVLRTYNSYQFGSLIISYLEMIFIVYITLTIICILFTGKGFKEHQVKN
ncbi:MAG: ABC transporter permease [Lachnospiraceae bacterium]|nr:ABC transporter permease [Lachnospiraceae bacterium]